MTPLPAPDEPGPCTCGHGIDRHHGGCERGGCWCHHTNPGPCQAGDCWCDHYTEQLGPRVPAVVAPDDAREPEQYTPTRWDEDAAEDRWGRRGVL